MLAADFMTLAISIIEGGEFMDIRGSRVRPA